MRILFTTLCIVMLPMKLIAATHPEVESALAWTLPELPCKQPKVSKEIQQFEASGGYISHSPTNTTEESSGAPTVFGIDHYKIERYQRKKKRWEKCISQYKSNLLVQFDRLKGVAHHGLTEDQATTIMSKLALIQSAVMATDGIPSSPAKTH